MAKQSTPPAKYSQPIRDYVGRTVKDDKEIVDFVPNSTCGSGITLRQKVILCIITVQLRSFSV